MMSGGATAPDGGIDVLRLLRLGTAAEHRTVERVLDLLDPELSRARLAAVLERMHGFWLAAEAGLDDWAARFSADAHALSWSRRRADLFAADLDTLGGRAQVAVPDLPRVPGTDEALGRLYVLEGSTLGGVLIDRHLAALPELSGVRVRAFSPYGSDTGAMWHAYRTAVRARVAAGGNAGTMVGAARATFAALAAWCHPVAVHAGSGTSAQRSPRQA
jgi:heme oxygenase (biliverdin-IX-beta and delta-forming)